MNFKVLQRYCNQVAILIFLGNPLSDSLGYPISFWNSFSARRFWQPSNKITYKFSTIIELPPSGEILRRGPTIS
jgi:hypothetical protein